MRETKSQLKERTEQIIKLLKRAHPDAHCALNHSSAFELLIATILSAQCTDERVNIVTADLFRKYRRPEDYLKVPAVELQQDVRTTGFFRNKTKSIQGACKMLVEEFGSEVPRTMDELLRLPGVARKTANVVLGVAYGIAAGVVVDTHVSRLSQRLRLTKQKDAGKIEAGFDGAGAAQRLDHLFAPADLSWPPRLQSPPAVVRRMRGGKTLPVVEVENREGAEVGA